MNIDKQTKFEKMTEFIKSELKDFKLNSVDNELKTLKFNNQLEIGEIDIHFQLYFGNGDYISFTMWFWLYNKNADCLFSSNQRFMDVEDFKQYIEAI